ncbi:ThiF family adenylyltransferase [Micromonospora zamorensis]|uniref:ThiF family adenylyltransferase n=1 Tax=Micromonospora zamorensis TaxID=709883 RepID=UPI0033A51A11
MSGSRLVRSSQDLVRLMQDGYAVRIVNGFLVVNDIPFVDDAAQVQRGSFLCPLDLSGDTTAPPSTHVMCFVGGVPRDKDGQPIDGLVNDGVERWSASPDLTATCGFSQKKPTGNYTDFHEKVTYYAAMVSGPAQAVDPDATPYTFKPVETDEDDGVFVFVDTYSSRAGITELNALLALDKVVIIGLGGTGSYLLDLLAKTPAVTLHLYDGDSLRSHNSFRAPGAASIDDLRAQMKKVEYYEHMYSAMRRGIKPHPINVTAENVSEILDANFVFLAMDTGPDKETIIKALTAHGVPFIDTGVGLSRDCNGVNGQIRITTSTPARTEHIERDGLISYFAGDDAEYDTNLQVAELNALTANLAVLRYKKLLGFYADNEDERHTVYALDSNDLHNRYGAFEANAEEDSREEPLPPEWDDAL